MMLNIMQNDVQLCVRMVGKYEAIFSCVSPERVPKGTVRTHWKRSRKWPFCVSGASAALYRSLESAGCTVKTGWYPPRYSKPRSVGERLHNSIEPKRQNGQSWTISTRHAHLVIALEAMMENEARGYLLPL